MKWLQIIALYILKKKCIKHTFNFSSLNITFFKALASVDKYIITWYMYGLHDTEDSKRRFRLSTADGTTE